MVWLPPLVVSQRQELLPEIRRAPFYGIVRPTYGVWCRHEKCWVSLGRYSLKDAWWALLEADSPHPWELKIRRIDTQEEDDDD